MRDRRSVAVRTCLAGGRPAARCTRTPSQHEPDAAHCTPERARRPLCATATAGTLSLLFDSAVLRGKPSWLVPEAHPCRESPPGARFAVDPAGAVSSATTSPPPSTPPATPPSSPPPTASPLPPTPTRPPPATNTPPTRPRPTPARAAVTTPSTPTPPTATRATPRHRPTAPHPLPPTPSRTPATPATELLQTY